MDSLVNLYSLLSMCQQSW